MVEGDITPKCPSEHAEPQRGSSSHSPVVTLESPHSPGFLRTLGCVTWQKTRRPRVGVVGSRVAQAS